jgi:hypothetical protein
MTWSCAYDVLCHYTHPASFIHVHTSSCPPWCIHEFIGASTCNRCAEDHRMSEAPQGVNPEAGVRLGAGGPVRRNRRKRGSRS